MLICVGMGQTLEHRQPVGDHIPNNMIILPSSHKLPLMKQLDCAQETTAADSGGEFMIATALNV